MKKGVITKEIFLFIAGFPNAPHPLVGCGLGTEPHKVGSHSSNVKDQIAEARAARTLRASQSVELPLPKAGQSWILLDELVPPERSKGTISILLQSRLDSVEFDYQGGLLYRPIPPEV